MPKFIYTILVLLIINIGALVFFLNTASPDSNINKALLGLLISFFFNLTIPTVATIIKIFQKSKMDFNSFFKQTFFQIMPISFFLGIIIFLRTSFGLSYFIISGLLIAFFVTKPLVKNYRKSRKKPKY
jgi:hypothetical protein